MSKRKRWTYQEVFDYFIVQGCLLLSESFTKQKDILEYICECGNPSKINFDNFKQGKRCDECKKIKCGNVRRLDFQMVKDRFELFGCTLISTKYQNNSELLDFICVCGKPNKISLNSLSSGKLCFDCGVIKKFDVMSKNGTAPTSSQQNHIAELINAEINYPVNSSWLDMAIPEEKLYLEYDGSGHWLRIKFEVMTEKEFIDNERARTYALLRRGWKEVRIISKRDKLPTDKIILEMFTYAKEYLNLNHHWISFDIDNGIVSSSQFKNNYDFGKLTKLDSESRKFKESVAI